jgi:hypothetical protein
LVGVAQVVPLKVVAYPELSTAAQKALVGQDTAVSLSGKPFTSLSIWVGVLHVLPLNVTTSPPPTAAQKLLVGQDTEESPRGTRIP